MSRQTFQKNGGFILAAVGASVGLGNVMRFPGLCMRYGSAFIAVYVGALLLFGVPLLCAELAWGRAVRASSPVAFKKLSPHLGAVGWAQVVCSFLSATAAVAVFGFLGAMSVVVVPLSLSRPSAPQAASFFTQSVLQGGALPCLLVACLVVVGWGLVYFGLNGGTKRLSSLARLSIVAVVLMLLLLCASSLLSPQGLERVGGALRWRPVVFTSAEFWLSALGQVFFSLSLFGGVMIVYGSYLPPRVPIVKSAVCVAVADAAVSLLATVAMAGSVGEELFSYVSSSGLVTAFTLYPVLLCQAFPSPVVSAVFGCAFYLSLLLIVWQSVQSQVEALLCSLSDGFSCIRARVLPIVCAVGAALSLCYCAPFGLRALQSTDLSINLYVVLGLGICQCIALGKRGQICTLVTKTGVRMRRNGTIVPFLRFLIAVVCPLLLCLLLLRQGIFIGRSPLSKIQLVYGGGSAVALVLATLIFAYTKSNRNLS